MDIILKNIVTFLFLVNSNVFAAKLEPCSTESCTSYFNQYKLSATRGHAQAIAMLGEFYYHGYGVEKNVEKAIYHYRNAAKKGITSAQYKAGLVYLVNEQQKNINKALRYLHMAAKAKYKDANYLLARVYLTDEFGVQNLEKADKFLSKAFTQYHSDIPMTLTYLAQKYQDNFPQLFPLLNTVYRRNPLEIRDGNLVWPNSQNIEVITVSGNQLESLFNLQLNSYRAPKKSLGSRLNGYSCDNTVGCYQLNSMQELGDFVF